MTEKGLELHFGRKGVKILLENEVVGEGILDKKVTGELYILVGDVIRPEHSVLMTYTSRKRPPVRMIKKRSSEWIKILQMEQV